MMTVHAKIICTKGFRHAAITSSILSRGRRLWGGGLGCCGMWSATVPQNAHYQNDKMISKAAEMADKTLLFYLGFVVMAVFVSAHRPLVVDKYQAYEGSGVNSIGKRGSIGKEQNINSVGKMKIDGSEQNLNSIGKRGTEGRGLEVNSIGKLGSVGSGHRSNSPSYGSEHRFDSRKRVGSEHKSNPPSYGSEHSYNSIGKRGSAGSELNMNSLWKRGSDESERKFDLIGKWESERSVHKFNGAVNGMKASGLNTGGIGFIPIIVPVGDGHFQFQLGPFGLGANWQFGFTPPGSIISYTRPIVVSPYSPSPSPSPPSASIKPYQQQRGAFLPSPQRNVAYPSAGNVQRSTGSLLSYQPSASSHGSFGEVPPYAPARDVFSGH